MAVVTRGLAQFKAGNNLLTVKATYDDENLRWIDLGDFTDGPAGTWHDTPPSRTILQGWVPVGEVVEDYLKCQLVSLELEAFTRDPDAARKSVTTVVKIYRKGSRGPWRNISVSPDTKEVRSSTGLVSQMGDIENIQVSFNYPKSPVVTTSRSLTLEESGHSESNSGTAPAHTLAGAPSSGELILWHLHCRSNDLTEITPPSGFQTDGPAVSAVSGYDMTYECFYKVAGASEGTTYTGSMTNSSHWAVGIEVISSTNGWTEGTALDLSTIQINTYTSPTTTMSTSSSGTLAGTEGWAVIGCTSRTGGETHSTWTSGVDTEDWDDSTGAGGGAISYAVAYGIRTVTTAWTATVTKSGSTQGVIATGAWVEDAGGVATIPLHNLIGVGT